MVAGTVYLVRLDIKNRMGNFSFEFDGETFAFLVLRSILTFTALAGSYQSVRYLSMTVYSGLHLLQPIFTLLFAASIAGRRLSMYKEVFTTVLSILGVICLISGVQNNSESTNNNLIVADMSV
jgi:drug/metabolite transporter (DMT)-like permease